MKLSIARFYPAHSSNYTVGRTLPIRIVTVHHTAANNQTLRYLWADPARNGSSHFFVRQDAIEQYVDTNDTAWTNTCWPSNCESISIEVNGNWQNGYYNQATLDKLTELFVALRKNYPDVIMSYHMDEAARCSKTTACPCDLKHKGYAKIAWDKATALLTPPATAPSTIKYEAITPKRVQLKTASNLWNFDFTKWADAKAVASYPAGHTVDVVATAINTLGGKYYMTAYSYNNGAVRAKNGFNIKDCIDVVIPATTPVTTAPPATTTPTDTSTAPVNTNTTAPTASDIDIENNNLLKQILAIVQSILNKIISIFK